MCSLMNADNSSSQRIKEKTSWSLHWFFGIYEEGGGIGPVKMANMSNVPI